MALSLFVKLGVNDAQYKTKMKGAKRTASSFAQEAQRRFNKINLKKAAVSVGAFAAAFVLASKKIISVAAEQEEIFRRLKTQLELQGKSWGDVEGEIDSFAKTLQATTKYGDTDTVAVLQKMLIFTDNFGEALRGTKLAMDVAASGLFDITTATRNVGLAMGGNIEIMGRYLSEFKAATNPILKTMSATEKAAFAMDVLTEKFGGAAEKELNSFNAKLKQMKNYIGDVTELIGDQLIRAIEPTILKTTEWLKANEDLVKTKVDKYVGNVVDSLKYLKQYKGTFRSVFEGSVQIAENIDAIASNIKFVIDQYSRIPTLNAIRNSITQPERGKLGFPGGVGPVTKGLPWQNIKKESDAIDKRTEAIKEYNRVAYTGGLGAGTKTSPFLQPTAGFDPLPVTRIAGEFAAGREAMNEWENTSAGLENTSVMATEQMSQGWVSLGEQISNVLANSAMTAGNAFENITTAFRRMLLRMAAEMAAKAAIFALFNLVTGGGFGIAAGGLKGFLGFRAAGGAVAAGNPYVVGEKGPELFVPQQSGKIVPNKEIAQSNLTVNFNSEPYQTNRIQLAENLRDLWRDHKLDFLKE